MKPWAYLVGVFTVANLLVGNAQAMRRAGYELPGEQNTTGPNRLVYDRDFDRNIQSNPNIPLPLPIGPNASPVTGSVFEGVPYAPPPAAGYGYQIPAAPGYFYPPAAAAPYPNQGMGLPFMGGNLPPPPGAYYVSQDPVTGVITTMYDPRVQGPSSSRVQETPYAAAAAAPPPAPQAAAAPRSHPRARSPHPRRARSPRRVRIEEPAGSQQPPVLDSHPLFTSQPVVFSRSQAFAPPEPRHPLPPSTLLPQMPLPSAYPWPAAAPVSSWPQAPAPQQVAQAMPAPYRASPMMQPPEMTPEEAERFQRWSIEEEQKRSEREWIRTLSRTPAQINTLTDEQLVSVYDITSNQNSDHMSDGPAPSYAAVREERLPLYYEGVHEKARQVLIGRIAREFELNVLTLTQAMRLKRYIENLERTIGRGPSVLAALDNLKAFILQNTEEEEPTGAASGSGTSSAPAAAATTPPPPVTTALVAAAAAAVAEGPSVSTTSAAPPENPLIARIRNSAANLSNISDNDLLEAHALVKTRGDLRDIYQDIIESLIVRVLTRQTLRENLSDAQLEDLREGARSFNLFGDAYFQPLLRQLEEEINRRNRLRSSSGAAAALPASGSGLAQPAERPSLRAGLQPSPMTRINPQTGAFERATPANPG